MTKRSTLQLTQDLVADLKPVRPLRSPWVRGVSWIMVVVLLLGAVALRLANLHKFAQNLQHTDVAIECVAALATGVISILAAFHASIPGPTRLWQRLPIIAGLGWLAATAYHCGMRTTAANSGFGTMADGSDCFKFITITSVPLTVALLAFLRKARPLIPEAVGAYGALGIAAFAALLLQTLHHLEYAPADLILHITAVGAVVAAGSFIGGRWLAR